MKNSEITDAQLINLIEGNPDADLEALIKNDAELQARHDELKEVYAAIEHVEPVEPPAHIDLNFRQAIVAEQNRLEQKFSWMHIAAAVAILVVGFGMGRMTDSTASGELAALRDEINSLREVTLTSALQQYSASERIMAVNRIEAAGKKTNPELINTLVNTLNADESPNVRYAALQALSGYMDDQDVRAKLVKSLASQKDALIQISLISILVEAEERSVIAPLKDIIRKDEIAPDVRKQAEIAIQVLT